MDWYPAIKTKSATDCPDPISLDFFESDQVQEVWVVEGDCGPEVMVWLDRKFANWFPKLTLERAGRFAGNIF